MTIYIICKSKVFILLSKGDLKKALSIFISGRVVAK